MSILPLHHVHSRSPRLTCPGRAGHVLLLLAILLPALLGIVGLVLDAGLMMSGQRALQNASDAAATRAAMDLSLDKSPAAATASATSCIHDNGFPDASVTVHIPPATGPFAGRAGHVEIIATGTAPSRFMKILDGVLSHNLSARSVAGVQATTADAAIVVLDPDPLDLTLGGTDEVLDTINTQALADQAIAESGLGPYLDSQPLLSFIANSLIGSLRNLLVSSTEGLFEDVLGEVSIAPTPALIGGLEVEGLGRLRVDGSILVNTRWGGEDERGQPAGDAAGPPYAISCMPLLPTTRVTARDIRVVGGVDNRNYYRAFQNGDLLPLQANRLPVPDPFRNLPTPSVLSDPGNTSSTVHSPANAVRIAVSVPQANQLVTGLIAQLSPLLQGLLQPLVAPLTDLITPKTMQPGVYNSITVLAPVGGVRFEPGIYVIRGVSPATNLPLCIVGPVEAEGVLFYITNNAGFSIANGSPDASDVSDTSPPNQLPTTLFSAVVIPLLPTARISGLDDPASPFNGMLIYQRRLDRRPILLEAQQLLGGGRLSGTIYSKWGHVLFVGGLGTYDLRFVCGTLRVVTVFDTTLSPTQPLPPARDVMLLE